MMQAYENNNPAKRDRIGIAQITKDNQKINLQDLQIGDHFTAATSTEQIIAQVIEKSKHV